MASYNLNDLYNLYAVLLNGLPKSYPKPEIIVHQTTEAMIKYVDESGIHQYQYENGVPPDFILAMYDAVKNTVHVPYLTLYTKSQEDLAEILLHEMAHCYFAKKHGANSKQFSDELACDAFARRWLKKLKNKINKIN